MHRVQATHDHQQRLLTLSLQELLQQVTLLLPPSLLQTGQTRSDQTLHGDISGPCQLVASFQDLTHDRRVLEVLNDVIRDNKEVYIV